MVGKDLIMATLFGSGGGSSGSGGGGGAGVSPKEVNFYDYDGTCVYAYTVAEAQALSELPAGPEHPGLVFQGWNWSLEGVKGLTRAMNIGAMYTTDDGTTRLYITLQEGRTSPMLGVGVNGTVTVDWGDGTEPDVLTGTSTSTTVWTPNHAYAAPGDYVIRLTVDGKMQFTGTSSSYQNASILRHASKKDGRNCAYLAGLRRVEVGTGVTGFGNYAFERCYSLSEITIPENVATFGGSVFIYCYSLRFVTIPKGVQSISTAFNQCLSLETVAIPAEMNILGSSTFSTCGAMKTVTIPDGETTFGNSDFSGCRSLLSIDIPDSVTTIGLYAFQYCTALTHVVFPQSITSIGEYAFNTPASVAFFDFTACTAVPTLSSTTAFGKSDMASDLEIRVPAALYDEWIAATNWATYADYIKAY